MRRSRALRMRVCLRAERQQSVRVDGLDRAPFRYRLKSFAALRRHVCRDVAHGGPRSACGQQKALADPREGGVRVPGLPHCTRSDLPLRLRPFRLPCVRPRALLKGGRSLPQLPRRAPARFHRRVLGVGRDDDASTQRNSASRGGVRGARGLHVLPRRPRRRGRCVRLCGFRGRSARAALSRQQVAECGPGTDGGKRGIGAAERAQSAAHGLPQHRLVAAPGEKENAGRVGLKTCVKLESTKTGKCPPNVRPVDRSRTLHFRPCPPWRGWRGWRGW